MRPGSSPLQSRHVTARHVADVRKRPRPIAANDAGQSTVEMVAHQPADELPSVTAPGP